MSRIVQARLDEETSSVLKQLQKEFGWSQSEAVRRGLLLLASISPKRGRRKFSGVGKYDTGIPDLSTNKKHMEGFGKS